MPRWSRGLVAAVAVLAAGWGLIACPSTDGFSGGGDAALDIATLPDVVEAASADADAGLGADADGSSTRCDPAQPFTTPIGIGPIDDGVTNVHSGRLSNDELTLFYVQDVVNDAGYESLDGDIYMATRASPTAVFGDGAPITAINSVYDDEDPYLLDDGLTLWFSSARVQPMQFFVAYRPSLVGPFGPAIHASNAGVTTQVINLSFTPDAGLAYFTVSKAITNDMDGAQLTVDGGIKNEFGLLVPDGSQWPCITGDGLTMYYDYMDQGGVYETTRPSTSVLFTSGAPVAELNGGGPNVYTQPTWISHDGCDIVVQSNTIAGGLGMQIYTAHRGM